MKRLLAILLALLIATSFSACKNNEEVSQTGKVDVNEEEVIKPDTQEEKEDEVKEENPVHNQEEDKKPDNKPAVDTTDKKPSQEVTTPSQTPSKEPSQKVENTPAPTTLGNTLLADFKKKASAGMDTLAIAEGLMQNEAILFSGGAMPIEEGYLSGFDNAEIKGFKSGAMFAPMIGSIAFVGYVFELEDGADAGAFISTLKGNANPRWNICVAADEMVTGSVGNKVFFVMCPTSLEQ